tara:strand:- start:286 stop:456 length:171 start_codon:yes stop_codon:yes gene_type:complete
MKYSVQYKTKENAKSSKEVEVSVDNYEELVSWLSVLRQLENVKDIQFSLVEEDLEL